MEEFQRLSATISRRRECAAIDPCPNQNELRDDEDPVSRQEKATSHKRVIL